MDGWILSDDNKSEQHNTLVLIDTVLGKENTEEKPTFYICGGTALLFHGILSAATVDIDICNKMNKNISNIVEPFISDAAASVIVLPRNWERRIIRYEEEIFENCNVYILSMIDLVVSKLASWRYKDIEDLKYTDMLQNINMQNFSEIVNNELPEDLAELVLGRLLSLV